MFLVFEGAFREGELVMINVKDGNGEVRPFESTVLSGGGMLFVDLDGSSPGYGSVDAALERTADLAFLFRSKHVRQRFAWLG